MARTNLTEWMDLYKHDPFEKNTNMWLFQDFTLGLIRGGKERRVEKE